MFPYGNLVVLRGRFILGIDNTKNMLNIRINIFTCCYDAMIMIAHSILSMFQTAPHAVVAKKRRKRHQNRCLLKLEPFLWWSPNWFSPASLRTLFAWKIITISVKNHCCLVSTISYYFAIFDPKSGATRLTNSFVFKIKKQPQRHTPNMKSTKRTSENACASKSRVLAVAPIIIVPSYRAQFVLS